MPDNTSNLTSHPTSHRTSHPTSRLSHTCCYYQASAQRLNQFYKQHHHEGRMHPDDIGILLCTPEPKPVSALRLIQHPNTWRLRHLFTAPAQRQQGLASHLLKLTLHRAHCEPAITDISLICTTELMPFYQQHGFRSPSEQPLILLQRFHLNRTELKLLRSSQYQLLHCPMIQPAPLKPL